MKQPHKSPVPAFTRGIQVLGFLLTHGDSSLQEAANRLNIPKSSLLRLLEELINLNLVARNQQTGHYYALQKLIPVIPSADQFREKVRNTLKGVSQETGYTAEWYIPSEEGLILVDREEPVNKEVNVLAKIGFIRKWNGELEAVSGIGYAYHCAPFPKHPKFWCYGDHGKKHKMSSTQAKSTIQLIKKNHYALDTFFNTQGIRRMAVPLVMDNQLKAVLAVAESLTPQHTHHQRNDINILIRYINHLP